MTWTFERPSFRLINSDGQRIFSSAEFARQHWPGCPVCGTEVDVDPVHAGDLNDRDKYMPGRWRCPRGCDRRKASDALGEQG